MRLFRKPLPPSSTLHLSESQIQRLLALKLRNHYDEILRRTWAPHTYGAGHLLPEPTILFEYPR